MKPATHSPISRHRLTLFNNHFSLKKAMASSWPLASLNIMLAALLTATSAFAGFQEHVTQFQQQMLFEAPIVSDFLAHVQTAYLSTHDRFMPIGSPNIQDDTSLARLLPKTTSIKNIYAQITPSPDNRYLGNITITVQFKDLRESAHTTAFFADSTIVYTALGGLGRPLNIPLDSTAQTPIEHQIVGFACQKIVKENTPIFASYSSGNSTIDLSSQLTFPFNICSI